MSRISSLISGVWWRLRNWWRARKTLQLTESISTESRDCEPSLEDDREPEELEYFRESQQQPIRLMQAGNVAAEVSLEDELTLYGRKIGHVPGIHAALVRVGWYDLHGPHLAPVPVGDYIVGETSMSFILPDGRLIVRQGTSYYSPLRESANGRLRGGLFGDVSGHEGVPVEIDREQVRGILTEWARSSEN